MKKTLMILGGIFAVAVVVIVGAIVFAAVKGPALDRESKQYAEATLPAIISQWDIQALQARTSPEFKAAVSDEVLEKLIRIYQKLGKLKEYKGTNGQANVSLTLQQGTVISARYIANADFEAGPATITLDLIKHGDQWQILSLRIDSKVFLE